MQQNNMDTNSRSVVLFDSYTKIPSANGATDVETNELRLNSYIVIKRTHVLPHQFKLKKQLQRKINECNNLYSSSSNSNELEHLRNQLGTLILFKLKIQLWIKKMLHNKKHVYENASNDAMDNYEMSDGMVDDYFCLEI